MIKAYDIYLQTIGRGRLHRLTDVDRRVLVDRRLLPNEAGRFSESQQGSPVSDPSLRLTNLLWRPDFNITPTSEAEPPRGEMRVLDPVEMFLHQRTIGQALDPAHQIIAGIAGQHLTELVMEAEMNQHSAAAFTGRGVFGNNDQRRDRPGKPESNIPELLFHYDDGRGDEKTSVDNVPPAQVYQVPHGVPRRITDPFSIERIVAEGAVAAAIRVRFPYFNDGEMQSLLDAYWGVKDLLEGRKHLPERILIDLEGTLLGRANYPLTVNPAIMGIIEAFSEAGVDVSLLTTADLTDLKLLVTVYERKAGLRRDGPLKNLIGIGSIDRGRLISVGIMTFKVTGRDEILFDDIPFPEEVRRNPAVAGHPIEAGLSLKELVDRSRYVRTADPMGHFRPFSHMAPEIERHLDEIESREEE